jgi:hypothetical protein
VENFGGGVKVVVKTCVATMALKSVVVTTLWVL